MSKFYGTSGLDIFIGPNAVNDYYFEFGELADTDLVIGGTASDRLTFVLHPLGGQFIFASAFTNVSSIEFVYLPDSSDYIELSNSLATGAVPVGSPPYDLYVEGNDGNDTIDASRVTSPVPLSIAGEEGNDTIIGGGSDCLYTGGNGDDEFTLTAGIETINAGNDEDSIVGNTSALDGDKLDGGANLDDLVLTSAGTFSMAMIGIESVLLPTGANKVTITSDAYAGGEDVTVHVEGGGSGDTITVTQGSPGLLGSTYEKYLIEANGGVDIVTGGANNDTLDGGAEGDALGGGGGNDRLIGGSGKDILSGGSGNDYYVAIEAGDIVNELLSTGRDTVETGLAVYTLSANIEVLKYTGIAAAVFTGNTVANTMTGSPNEDDLIRGGDGADTITGLGGADTIRGQGGNDTLDGYVGDDLVQGADGNDYITGNSGYDDLRGGNQNDTIFGGSNDDTLTGGQGDDLLQGDGGNDTLKGNAGSDTASYSGIAIGIDADLTRSSDQVVAGSETDQLSGIEHITGGEFDDVIRGDALGNTLTGNGGADTLDGGTGDDVMTGGSGLDTVDYSFATSDISAVYSIPPIIISNTEIGRDTVSGVEQIISGAGDDLLAQWAEAHGGAGNDSFVTNGAVNRLYGDEGEDTVIYDDVPSTISLIVDLENASLNKNAADGDTLEGIENITYIGNDTAMLSGDAENNRLQSSGTLNSLFGRGGDDVMAALASLDIVDGGEGTDSLDYGASSAAVTLTQVGTVIQGLGAAADGDGAVNVETLIGSAFDDTMKISTGDFTLLGGDGADSLTAGSGADTLDGGTGADAMAGGKADDTYFVDDAGDVVTELSNQGSDIVNTTLGVYTLTANVDRLNYAGAGSFIGVGNLLGNTISALDGNDRFIDVLGGADAFIGSGGTDIVDYRTSAAGAVLNFATNVHSGAAAGDSFTSIERFIGSATATDTMTGAGAGRFTFFGDGGNDVLTGANNADLLVGGDGNDILSGATDIDTLSGEAGNDTLTGGDGADLFQYGEAAFGQDTIKDFQDGADLLKIFSAVGASIADFAITGNGTSSVRLAMVSDPTSVITLNGAAAITISAADFLFY